MRVGGGAWPLGGEEFTQAQRYFELILCARNPRIPILEQSGGVIFPDPNV